MSASAQPVTKQFDDIFHAKFMKVIAEWNSTANRPDLTQVDRKEIIQNSYQETDEIYFGRRQLSDRERKLRALTKLFYKVLSEEPWSESWIRAPDVERKLSRFELHKDSEAGEIDPEAQRTGPKGSSYRPRTLGRHRDHLRSRYCVCSCH